MTESNHKKNCPRVIWRQKWRPVDPWGLEQKIRNEGSYAISHRAPQSLIFLHGSFCISISFSSLQTNSPAWSKLQRAHSIGSHSEINNFIRLFTVLVRSKFSCKIKTFFSHSQEIQACWAMVPGRTQAPSISLLYMHGFHSMISSCSRSPSQLQLSCLPFSQMSRGRGEEHTLLLRELFASCIYLFI